MSAEPGTERIARTPRGARTRARLVQAAEQVFTELGYHEASIVRIVQAAGVAPGTFYLYFSGKRDIFDEVVEDLNRRVRHAMAIAAASASTRLEAERRGFQAFFRFTTEHPSLYRVIRQAEFVSPAALQLHYERIVEGYARGLREAMAAGEIEQADPEALAWALMGIGEMIGLRWILWGATGDVPQAVFDEAMRFIRRGLGVRQ